MLPKIGCIRQPKSLLVTALPIKGNIKLRLPFPSRGAGLGVILNTWLSEKLPSPPTKRAETGTLNGASGNPSGPPNFAFLFLATNATPLARAHSLWLITPELHNFSRFGTYRCPGALRWG